MKKLYIFLLIILPFQFYAQCPGCSIDMSCAATPAKPTMCPDTLPPGTALEYYDQDVTFYMPAQFVDQGSGLNVTLNRIEVIAVVGMPQGLQFQSSSPNNNFYPSSNPPQSERGCAKFCGTPLIPGNYTITVFVKAYVTVMGINQTVDDNFQIPITILPAQSGNSSFIIANSIGCAPVTATFVPIHQSNGNPKFSYLWNFGNGNLSNQEFPPPQTYSNPGNYIVSLTTTIDTFGYYLNSITISTTNCNDGIWGKPDPYIKILKHSTNTLVYQSSYVDNTNNATFNFSTITLENIIYRLEIWDYDSGLLGGDDFCASFTFNGHTAGQHSYSGSNSTATFTIEHPILQFSDSDTVRVYPNPTINQIIIYPASSACTGDSILLTVISNGTQWQWYKDSIALPGITADWMIALTSGNYFVEVMNQYGCSKISNSVFIEFIPYPPIPTIWQTGNMLQTNLTGYALQWYLNNNPIPGAIYQTLTITESGYYMLEAKNSLDCSTFSNSYYAIYQSTEEFVTTNLKIYPNPVTSLVTIDFGNYTPQYVRIKIFDLLGRLLYEIYEHQKNIIYLHIEHLPANVYSIQIATHSTLITKQIIKY